MYRQGNGGNDMTAIKFIFVFALLAIFDVIFWGLIFERWPFNRFIKERRMHPEDEGNWVRNMSR
jgi:hypothetical protein